MFSMYRFPLYSLYNRERVISSGEDGLLMKDVKDGCFSVKLFFLFLASARDSLFPSCLV